MKILERKELNMRYIWTGRCKTCDSKLRLIEPQAGDNKEPGVRYFGGADGDIGTHEIQFVCPVCGTKNDWCWTNTDSDYYKKLYFKFDRVKTVLTDEDKEEMGSWGK